MVSVLLSGVTSGIGAHLLMRCVDAGYEVSVVVRKKGQADDIKKHFSSVTCLVCDLSDTSAVSRLAKKLEKLRFDFVIWNAGTAQVGKFHELPASSIDDTLSANLTAHMKLTRALLPRALPDKTKFCFTSSLAARAPGRRYAAYSVAKAGVSMFCSALRAEYPDLEVLCVEIGAVRTPFHGKAGMDVDNSGFVSHVLIADKYFDAMHEKSGIVTLHPRFYWIRKGALWFPELVIRAVRRRSRRL